MADEPKDPKLDFAISHCTGEDEAFPVSQLVRHTSSTRGWHSEKLCEFPQDIVLRFNGEVHISMLRILVHETKIPSRIDIHVCRPEHHEDGTGEYFPPVSSAVFHRLGYLTFTNNEASNFESRELKTAALNTRAVYLKLSIRRCHANMSNVFNQVGIVALGVYGEVINEYAPPPTSSASGDADGVPAYAEHLPGSVRESMQLQLRRRQSAPEEPEVPLDQLAVPGAHRGAAAGAGGAAAAQQETSTRSASAGPAISARPCLGTALEPVIARTIDDLSAKKAKAVEAEDFDEAKRLKILVDRLRDCGMALSDLEERKRRAIEAEDYDVAKALKLQIDDLKGTVRAELENAQTVPDQQKQQQQQAAVSRSPEHAKQESPQPNAQQQFDDMPVGGGGGAHHVPSPNAQEKFDETPIGGGGGGGASRPPPPARQSEPEPEPVAQQQPRTLTPTEYDERPAVAGGGGGGGADSDTGGIVVGARGASAGAGAGGGGGGGASFSKTEPVTTDWEKQLVGMISSETSSGVPPPEPLPQQLPAELVAHTAQFGRYTTSCLISKKFQHREAAVRVLGSDQCVAMLQARASKDPVALVGQLVQYLGDKGHGVEDSISQAFFAACDVIKTVLTAGISGVAVQDVQQGVEKLIPPLLLKAGDSNQRVREHASATLMLIAMSPIGPEKVAGALLHDPQADSKKPLNFRVQAARLSLGAVMLAKVGLSTRARPTGLTAEALTKQLCVPQLTHSHGDVREAAVHLIVALYGAAQAKTMERLLEDVAAPQKALIDEQLAAAGPAASSQSQAKGDEMGEEELKSTSISVGRPSAPGANAALAAARDAAKSETDNSAVPPAKNAAAKAPAAKPGRKTPATPRGAKAPPGKKAAPAPKVGAKKAAPSPKVSTSSTSASASAASAASPGSPPSRTGTSASTATGTGTVVSASSPTKSSSVASDEEDEHTCQFCNRTDPRYDAESLDRHFLRSCPMLCVCPLDGQIVEISGLQEHLLQECSKKHLVRECPGCREAIRAQDLEQHIVDGACVPFKPAEYNVCPLCHEKTKPGDDGWREHFATAPGCGNNPRPFDGGNIEEDFHD